MPAIRTLPEIYPITGAADDEAGWWARLERLAGAGHALVQLRPARGAPVELREAAARAQAVCVPAGIGLVLNGPLEVTLESILGLVRDLGLAGVHLSARRLRECETRPVPRELLLGASCHSAAELARAHDLGADYAFLSPVCLTASHPGVQVLGWAAFSELTRQARLPVYALGGVGPNDLERALGAGACGVAGISAYWD